MTSMQHLYLIVPSRPAMLSGGPTEAEAAAIDAHFAYLQGLLAEGRLILAGRTSTQDERVFGIVILDVADPDEARRLMEEDPAVGLGVMRAQLFPYQVALSR